MARVLVIGDVHEPACHIGYKYFVKDLYDSWDCDSCVFIGDIVDHHCISFHQKDVDADGVSREAEIAFERIQVWNELFPKATVTIGNHDERVLRLAASVNIPSRFIKDYKKVWGTPKWDWVRDTTIDNVHYLHGTGFSGKTPALTCSSASMMSTVIGHCHSVGGVHWSCGPTQRVFGMDTGCGVDISHPAMAYGKNLIKKPVLSAGVVIDGTPYHEIMPIASGEKYNKSRFKK